MILSRRRYIVVAISVLALALWTSHVAAAAPTPRLKRHYDPRKAGTKKKKSPVKIKGHSHLSLDQYTQLRQLSTNLLTQYDPSQHVIVGLGRAPAALVSLLRQLTPEIAHHYPAGGLSGSGGEQALASLQTQHSNHFEKLLGDEVLSSGRTIVLVDRALSGRSLLVAKQLLETHLRQMGKATKVLAVGASEQPIAGLDGHLDISGLPEMQKLNWQMYDAIAPYRRHIVGQPHRVKDLKVNKAAKDFDRALRRRMLEDEELDSFLLQRFADSVLVSAGAERGVEGPEARLASRSKAARPEEPTQKGSDASGKKPLDLFGNLKRQLGHAVPEWLATRQKAPAAAPKKKRSLVTKDKPVTKEALKGPSPAESKSRPKRKEKSWEDILSEKPKTRRKGRKKAAGTLALRYDGENYALLSQDEYQGIRTAVESIVKNFPPHLYHYVGVGRTSAPFLAMLHNLDPKSYTYLAADSLHKKVEDGTAFPQYFQALPPEVTSGKKRVLLLRRATSDRSLRLVAGELHKWLRSSYQNPIVHTVGISTRGKTGTGWLDVSGSAELKQMLETDAYKAMAPYPNFRIGTTDPKKLVWRPEHDTYRSELAKLMAADPKIATLKSARWTGQ